MMHEEFTRLSKVETTLMYYEEFIEPKYTVAGLDKEAFVAQWLKDNKASIVKAHAFDIDRASTALAVKGCNAAELERAKIERDEAREQLERTKSTLEQVSRQNDEYYNRKVEAQERAKEYSKFEPELAAAKETIAAKDAEIQRLKAMLFDAMYNGSKAA